MKQDFQDPSLKRMYHAISVMSRQYRNQSWPSERIHWEADLSDEVGTGLSGILFDLSRHGYVKVKGGTNLNWKQDRVLETAQLLPDELKRHCGDGDGTGTFRAVPSANSARLQNFQLNNGRVKCLLIDNARALDDIMEQDPLFSKVPNRRSLIAIDCEGVPDSLELIQIAKEDGTVYLFDCRKLGTELVCKKLKSLLTSKTVVKFIHDLHQDAVALDKFGSIALEGVLDTQLAAEHLWGHCLLGFNALLGKLELPPHPSKDFVHAGMKSGADLFKDRPIPQQYLEYAAMDVSCLIAAQDNFFKLVDEKVELEGLLHASMQRARNSVQHNGMRSFCFDVANDYALASPELMRTMRIEEGFYGEPLVVESNVEEVIQVLPSYLRSKLQTPSAATNSPGAIMKLLSFGTVPSQESKDDPPRQRFPHGNLSDIVLDSGRRPQCWVDDERVFLCEDQSKVVTSQDLSHIESCLGQFGTDNRAGLNGKLHRFSAMRNRDRDMAGITIRIGRNVRGNAAMLMDFLLGSDKSILILGEPGSGKTTIVREATRRLAERSNVVVVDTSNEIAGDGMVPHACIGLARRMMVPSLDMQSAIMVECVQNHTPHVMVIDEIGRPKEVQAARTVKQRGVRMIASAHGDLRRLLKNKELSGLVGGVEHVMMGDTMAREEADRKRKLAKKQNPPPAAEEGANPPADTSNNDDTATSAKSSFPVSKTKVQRGGDPTFEVIVEVRRGCRHEWRCVDNSAKAVDCILDGFHYKAQLRVRDPESGNMRMEFIEA